MTFSSRSLAAASLLALLACASASVVTEDITETGKSARDLVSLLAREGEILDIQNVKISGVATQFGTFQGGGSAIGLESGIVLGSGHVTDIDGTNDDTLDSGAVNSSSSGDKDLEDAHYYDIESVDAASISFSFKSGDLNRVALKYVFGSEEYYYQGMTDYQDAVAIFVNDKNCALISTDTAVNVNTISSEQNSDLYINNADGSRAIELHGFTTVLECIAPVIPGEVNTMKIVIADGFEAGLDSAVFLGAKSFGASVGFPCKAHAARGLCMRPVSGGDYRLPSCQINNCKAGHTIDEAGDECCDIDEIAAHRVCPVDEGKSMILGEVLCCDTVKVEIARPNGHKLCLA